MAEIVCVSCRQLNAATANFCSACGTALLRHASDSTMVLSTGDHGADASGELTVEFGAGLPPAMLVVRSGPDAGQVFDLDRTVTTLGRAPDNDIFLDDVTVSRRHAVIVAGPDGYSLRDAGSLNGTYRNRERIGQAELVPGDEVQVGKFRLVFLRPGDTVAGPDS